METNHQCFRRRARGGETETETETEILILSLVRDDWPTPAMIFSIIYIYIYGKYYISKLNTIFMEI